MKNRRILFLFVGAVAVALGIYLSLRTPTQKQKAVLPIVRTAASPPALTLVPDAPTNVLFSFDGSVPAYPDKLPVYRFSPRRYFAGEISTIATSLGFSSPPVKRTVGAKTKQSWNTTESSLSFYDDGATQSWSYARYISSPSSQPVADVAATTGAFVGRVFLLENEVHLVLKDRNSGPFDGLVINDSAPVSLTGFSFVVNTAGGYPVVSAAFEESVITAITDAGGTIRSLTVLPPLNTTPVEERPILTTPEAVASLNDNRGLLVFAGTRVGNVLWGEGPTFQSVSLASSSLVYYPNETTGLLLPFFLFEGTATTTEGVSVMVRYAVAATE